MTCGKWVVGEKDAGYRVLWKLRSRVADPKYIVWREGEEIEESQYLFKNHVYTFFIFVNLKIW